MRFRFPEHLLPTWLMPLANANGRASQPGADPKLRRGVKLSRLLQLTIGPEKGVQDWFCRWGLSEYSCDD